MVIDVVKFGDDSGQTNLMDLISQRAKGDHSEFGGRLAYLSLSGKLTNYSLRLANYGGSAAVQIGLAHSYMFITNAL